MTTEKTFFEDDAALAAFLADDWQQRPRFLAGALATLPTLPDWRALCADEDIECRRVTTDNGTYTLEHGPLDGDDPALPWTVLIQDADYHAPGLRPLLNAMHFLPRWRLEDIMMSVATTGASVGPHVDAYDVFLVQARGTRGWQVGRVGDYSACDDDGGLRLVEPFEAQHNLTATPGDVLYLPPEAPHHGIAMSDDCVTLSIGFRAPSLQDVAATLLAEAPSEPRYRDPGIAPATHSGLIDSEAIGRLRSQLAEFAALGDAHLLAALGELVTEPKDWLAPESRERSWPNTATQAVLSAGARLAFGHTDSGGRVFANGLAFSMSDTNTEQFIAGLASGDATNVPTSAAGRALLQQLWEDGVVDVYEESAE